MSQSIAVLVETIAAGAVIAAYRAVDATGNYPLAATRCLGVTEMGADAVGDLMPVTTIGTAIVTVGEAVALDDALEVGANGVLMVKDTGVTVARARQVATGANQNIEVFLLPS